MLFLLTVFVVHLCHQRVGLRPKPDASASAKKQEVAHALAALTGEPHPLATHEPDSRDIHQPILE